MPELDLVFDRETATVDSIQRAAYRFADRFTLDLQPDETSFRCRLIGSDGAEFDAHQIATEFRTEVLDQVLRARIREQTSAERNAILALAFSNTGLVEPV